MAVHIVPDTLGDTIKNARKNINITMEALANNVGITERYLYRIENENKKPSFDVLYNLVRELSIPADAVFYPEKPSKDSQIEDLIRSLYNCDEQSIKVVRATVKSLLENQSKE